MTSSTASSPPGSALVPVFLKLPPEHIVSLKFVIESYEGIGIVRTIDPRTGEAVVLALADTIQTVEAVLDCLKEELQLAVIPAPPTVSGDWLLSEEYPSRTAKDS